MREGRITQGNIRYKVLKTAKAWTPIIDRQSLSGGCCRSTRATNVTTRIHPSSIILNSSRSSYTDSNTPIEHGNPETIASRFSPHPPIFSAQRFVL